MECFVTDCEFKTPSMKVKVFDNNKKFKEEYDAPPGFQLDRYVMSLYPKSMISMRFLDRDEYIGKCLCVDIYEKDKFIGRYLGVYKTKS